MPEPTLPIQATEPQVETEPVKRRNGIVELFRERASRPDLSTDQVMDIDGPLAEKTKESAELFYRYGDHAVAWADCQAVKAAYQVIADVGGSHYELFRRDDPSVTRVNPVDEIEIISEGYLIDRSITDPKEAFKARWEHLKESLRRNSDLPDPSEHTPKIGKYDIMDEGLIPASDREQTLLALAKVEVAKNLVTRRLAEKSYDIPEENIHIRKADEPERQKLYKQLETMFLYSQLLKNINALRDKWEPEVFPTSRPKAETPANPQVDEPEESKLHDTVDGLPALVRRENARKPENSWARTLGELLNIPEEKRSATMLPLKTESINPITGVKTYRDLQVNNQGSFRVPANLFEASALLLEINEKGKQGKNLDWLYARLEGGVDANGEKIAIARLMEADEVNTIYEMQKRNEPYQLEEVISEIEPPVDNQSNNF